MKRKTVSVLFCMMMLLFAVSCGNETGGPGTDEKAGENVSEGTDVSLSEEPTDAGTTTDEGEDKLVDIEPNYDGIKTSMGFARVSLHDPSMDVFDGKYYMVGSHMTSAVSDDMSTWKMIGNGYNKTNRTYGEIFSNLDGYAYSGLGTSFMKTDDGGNHVWAPDIIYNERMGKYMMYYCYSSTWNTSNLAFAVSDTPEGPYEYQAPLIYSGFSGGSIEQTNVLDVVTLEWAEKNYYPGKAWQYNKWPNAIDPAVFFDEDGRFWMVYGSWSGGIFLLELDPETGLVIHPEADAENLVDPYFGKKLLGGNHMSIEGPSIEYSSETGFYYLYVSYGGLAQKGGYQIRVFRSENPDGPYLDTNGKSPMGSGQQSSGVKLSGNYRLPGQSQAYMATGGQSAFTDTDGKSYLVYHTRFENRGETHEPVVKQVLYNEEKWPCLLPYKTSGETVSKIGYAKEEIVGDYFFVDNGTAINATIAEPVMIRLHEDGRISGGVSGTWSVTEGSCFIHLILDDVSFSGVLCKQNDTAGTNVMTFSAIGGIHSVWGVKY